MGLGVDAALRAAGDSIPGPGPFTVYRGVAGHEPARRVRGLSWSASAEKAQWFAERFGLFDPAVYRITVPKGRVLAYMNGRQEQEFVLLLGAKDRPIRLDGEKVRMEPGAGLFHGRISFLREYFDPTRAAKAMNTPILDLDS